MREAKRFTDPSPPPTGAATPHQPGILPSRTPSPIYSTGIKNRRISFIINKYKLLIYCRPRCGLFCSVPTDPPPFRSQTNKNLIATVQGLEFPVTYRKQRNVTISNRNKSRLFPRPNSTNRPRHPHQTPAASPFPIFSFFKAARGAFGE
jgi:hypothetical protein